MKVFFFVLALALFAAPSMGKVFTRCSLAKELKRLGVAAGDIPYYVCIARYESNYNTAAVGPPNNNKSRDYGIFQINNYYWCSPPDGGFSHNSCKINCKSLLTDDISPDVKCAQLVKKQQGWKAWSTYKFCTAPASVNDCY
ncbi:LysS.2 family protein [Megaselia abdita]